MSLVTRLVTSTYSSMGVHCRPAFPVLFHALWQKPRGLQAGLAATLNSALHGPGRCAYYPACNPDGCSCRAVTCTTYAVCCLNHFVACVDNRSKHCYICTKGDARRCAGAKDKPDRGGGGVKRGGGGGGGGGDGMVTAVW